MIASCDYSPLKHSSNLSPSLTHTLAHSHTLSRSSLTTLSYLARPLALISLTLIPPSFLYLLDTFTLTTPTGLNVLFDYQIDLHKYMDISVLICWQNGFTYCKGEIKKKKKEPTNVSWVRWKGTGAFCSLSKIKTSFTKAAFYRVPIWKPTHAVTMLCNDYCCSRYCMAQTSLL